MRVLISLARAVISAVAVPPVWRSASSAAFSSIRRASSVALSTGRGSSLLASTSTFFFCSASAEVAAGLRDQGSFHALFDADAATALAGPPRPSSAEEGGSSSCARGAQTGQRERQSQREKRKQQQRRDNEAKTEYSIQRGIKR
jgi:hypothetical protein